MGFCRIAQSADIFSQGYRNKTGCGIGHHAHGVADPVASIECLVCSIILVNQNGNGMGMIQLQRFFSCIHILKTELMAVHSICREFAYTYSIRPQKIGCFFDMTCYYFRVIQKGGLALCHVPIPERSHIISHPCYGS